MISHVFGVVFRRLCPVLAGGLLVAPMAAQALTVVPERDIPRMVSFGGACVGCDLSGRQLSGARFQGADFSESILIGADLRDASLRGADFSRSDLSSSDLTGADITGADFEGARLRAVRLDSAWIRSSQRSCRNPHCSCARGLGRHLLLQKHLCKQGQSWENRRR
jgi:hypothetical protein